MRKKIGCSTRCPITRRDFVGAALVGSGAMLLGAPPPARAQGLTTEWNGYAGIGDYARSNGNVASVVNAAHAIRDGIYESRLASAAKVDDPYDLIIVGGGFAGIIAATSSIRHARTAAAWCSTTSPCSAARRSKIKCRSTASC